MTKFFDGRTQVTIQMFEYDNHDGTRFPDWENDFYSIGLLDYDEERGAWKVDDVECLIESAQDWQNAIGDFAMDEPRPGVERFVIVSDIREF